MEPATMQFESRLPRDWMPDGASVLVLVRMNDEGVWESIVPDFNIAGRGDSANDGLVNALELLDDYLSLCVAEGKSFAEAQRPVSVGFRFSILSELLALAAGRKIPRRRQRARRDCEYKIPLRLVGVA